MNSKNIFIHIPKTGGTTINCVINKTDWQTKPDFNYRHILYETKRSNSKDIFNPTNYNKYENYNIFMLVRHPVDRIISEYYFIKDRSEFISLIKPKPKNLKEYITNKQTQNYMVGFLLGKRMYDTDYVSESDLQLVKNTIRNLNIHVGIFEEYDKSLSFFSSVTGIKIPKKIDVKRVTLNRPKTNEISEDIKNLILKHNHLDLELYNFCKDLFYKSYNDKNIKSLNIKFSGGKYNYILKYTERFNLLEVGLKNKDFININNSYFAHLNKYLHTNPNIKNGKDYVYYWNLFFKNTLTTQIQDKNILSKVNNLELTKEDPLENTFNFCSILNKTNIKQKTPLVFNKDLVEIESVKFNVISKIKSLF